MKNVTSTNEPVNPCCDESDGKRHVMFASRPYPRFIPWLDIALWLGLLLCQRRRVLVVGLFAPINLATT